MNYEDTYEAMYTVEKDKKRRLQNKMDRATSEISRLTLMVDLQHAEAERYSRYSEKLETALMAIDAVQYEGYDPGDAWKAIREIIYAALEEKITQEEE